jgi:hypothetical protein
MKTFTDLFPDESEDKYPAPRRIIKASLKTAGSDNGSGTKPAQAGGNENDLNESSQKSSV